MTRLREAFAEILREEKDQVSREWIHEQEMARIRKDLDSRSTFGEEYRRAVARRIRYGSDEAAEKAAKEAGGEKVLRLDVWTKTFGS